MSWTESEFGYQQQFHDYFIFFGKKTADLNKLKSLFPQLTFKTVQQTHSDICVQDLFSNINEQKADAHFTDDPNIALVVKTADCMPILIADETQKRVLSIHAGWRGVENKITSKSIDFAKLNSAQIFIGPYILQKSFAVDLDVKELLLKSYNSAENLEKVFQQKDTKFYIDLEKIVLTELGRLEIPMNFHFLSIDTVTNLEFNSYRRDRSQSGRNLSFIARLK